MNIERHILLLFLATTMMITVTRPAAAGTTMATTMMITVTKPAAAGTIMMITITGMAA